MKEASRFKRYPLELQTLTNTITSEYYNNFFQTNEKRIESFFNQLRARCCEMYSEKMQSVFDTAKSHFEEADLRKLHDLLMDTSSALVCVFSFKIKKNVQFIIERIKCATLFNIYMIFGIWNFNWFHSQEEYFYDITVFLYLSNYYSSEKKVETYKDVCESYRLSIAQSRQ